MSYRLFRLRRLIALGMTPTLAALFLVSGQVAQPELTGLALVACFPLIHVLGYPGQWMETIAVSIASVAMTLAGPFLDFAAPPLMRGLWFALYLTLALLVFCAVIWLISVTVMMGPTRRITLRSVAMSKLDPAALKAAITLYPGRDDDHATCFAANADGLFRVTLHLQKIIAAPEQDAFEPLPDTAHALTEEGELETDAFLTCRVEKSTEAEHHVVYHMGDDAAPGVTIHRFEQVAGGTRVTALEQSQAMPFLLPWGMWLEDYATDHLICEIERAEGAVPLSNRNRTMRQFVVDLAWVLKPILGNDQPQP